MKIRIINIFIVVNCIFFTQINAQHKITGNDYTKALKKVTDIMVNDVTSPVAASRYYAYLNLASYETNSFFCFTFTSQLQVYSSNIYIS